LYKHTILLNRPVRGVRPIPIAQAKPFHKAHGGGSPGDSETIQRLEEEYQARSENSYKFGFEDGRKIGLDEGREEVRSTVEALRRMLASVSEERLKLLRDAETAVFELTLSIARRIIHREVQINPEIIRRVVAESLRLVEERQSIQLRVSPSDWKHVKSYEQELIGTSHGIKALEIREDERIEPGGCVIESESGIVDARIQTQLDEIAGLLSDTLQTAQPAG